MKSKIIYFLLLLLMVGCKKDEDDGGNGGGGNGNCQWEMSSNKIEVISVTTGTECDNTAMSVAVTLKNISDAKIRVAICFEVDVLDPNAKWSYQDHTLEVGDTKKLSICDYGTGVYKYWALAYSGNENCQAPNCNQ